MALRFEFHVCMRSPLEAESQLLAEAVVVLLWKRPSALRSVGGLEPSVEECVEAAAKWKSGLTSPKSDSTIEPARGEGAWQRAHRHQKQQGTAQPTRTTTTNNQQPTYNQQRRAA